MVWARLVSVHSFASPLLGLSRDVMVVFIAPPLLGCLNRDVVTADLCT